MESHQIELRTTNFAAERVSCQVSNVTPFVLSVSMAVCLVMV
jgi:hypothetical protein